MIETVKDRSTAKVRLAATWERTDRIFEILAKDAWLAQPIALRHPFIFYLGHLPAFAWNHVCVGVLGHAPFNAAFDELFSRGIDPDVDDPAHCHDHPEIPDRWPSLDEVLSYRDQVRSAILDAIDPVSERSETHVMGRNGRVFSMVIEHEQMHQETLLYMLAQLDFARKVRPAWLPAYALGAGRPAGRVEVPSGMAKLGAAIEDVAFGWDNEFSALERLVPAFSIDATPVTNTRFRVFVEDRGYERRELWQPDDWQWREESGLDHPVVWERHGDRWLYRTIFDLLPLEAVGDWAVYVSLAEARAYARWQGARLPTEAEFHRAAFGDAGAGERRFPWGAGPAAKHGNFNFHQWAPMPVGSHPSGASVWGVQDLIGDGWEWTDTIFEGLPGFEAYIPGYPGYSADFFDGKHYVLKGASWATADDLVRPSFRNWFQAHYPYVFAKFRCVGSPSPAD
jgi:ergothioneine biosynthesis protein EgtB